MAFDKMLALKELGDVLAACAPFEGTVTNPYKPGKEKMNRGEISKLTTLCAHAVERWAPPNSAHVKRMNHYLAKNYGKGNEHLRALDLHGVVSAIWEDYVKDRLANFSEIVRGEVYSDFLSLADHLLEEERKGNASVNAAAVLIGGVLEEHLRKLCQKSSPAIPLDYPASKGKMQRKNLERLNTDLYKHPVYLAGDHKLITAWGEIRNQAAHKTGLTVADQKKVEAMLIGVQDFITRYPA
jgi:hypothetical protein